MTEVQQGSLAEEIERMVHAFSDATRRQRVRELAEKVAELEASEQRHVREWADAIREEEWKRDEATRMRDALETRAEAAEAEVARLREEQAAWDRQSLADWQKVRAQLDAAVAEAARLRGEYARGLRAAADVARAHGGISASYAIMDLLDAALAMEVEP